MKTLDKSRPFATVFGDASHAYEQDGALFDRAGNEVGASSAPAATQKPAAAESAEQSQESETTGSANIESLGLATKIENALLGAGLKTVDALCTATKAELIELPNIGEAAVKEIVKALKTRNRKLAG